MRRTVLLYGISLAILVVLLKLLEYRFFVHDLSLEIYVGIIAILFTAMGVWVGRKLISHKTSEAQIIHQPAPPTPPKFEINEEALKQTGISPREYEVLQEMANGHSNQEIADKLFVSLSTVKTHSANLFIKLDVKRRTQAVQRAKETGLIP
jgi:DNA-binding NarL/FixJ family response regulator